MEEKNNVFVELEKFSLEKCDKHVTVIWLQKRREHFAFVRKQYMFLFVIFKRIIQKRYSSHISYKKRIGLIRCGIIIIAVVVLRLSHIVDNVLRSNLFTKNKLSYWNLAEIEQ